MTSPAPSSRTIARIFLTVVGLSVALYLLWLVRTVVGLLLISIFLAVALGPAVDSARRLKLRRVPAILVVYLFLFLAVFVVASLVVPPIVDQVENFVDDVPSYIEEIRSNDRLREFDDEYGITDNLQQQARTLPTRLSDAAGALQAVTVGVLTKVVQLVTVLTVTFFLLLDGRRITDFLFSQLAPDREARFRRVGEDVYRSVGGFVTGALSLALLSGITSWLVLTILGVPFAVPLGVLMAFLALIPIVGATIGGAIVAAVTLFQDFPRDTIAWVLFALAYQQLENNVLQPQVYRRTVDLHPLAVIAAILFGSALLGVLGALLAIPIAAATQIVVKDAWAHRGRRRIPIDPDDRSPVVIPP
jgi:predicted PurR-regulated permease PerM